MFTPFIPESLELLDLTEIKGDLIETASEVKQPERVHGFKIGCVSLPKDPYDTCFNGVMIDVPSFGIFGYHIYNRNDIKVYGDDLIYLTSEPKNIAPLEFLTVYQKGVKPYVTVFDWGTGDWARDAHGNFFSCIITDDFSKQYGIKMQAPNGEYVTVFRFQNYFEKKLDRNLVLLLDANNNWQRFYTSPVTGIPGPYIPGQPSGWSVFEYKRLKGTTTPWANVPFMLGTMGLQIMDQNGYWFAPSGIQSSLREDTSVYARVFAEPNISSAYRS